jgi:hypothetical protein
MNLNSVGWKIDMPTSDLTSFGHTLDVSPQALGKLRHSNPSPAGLPVRKAKHAELV